MKIKQFLIASAGVLTLSLLSGGTSTSTAAPTSKSTAKTPKRKIRLAKIRVDGAYLEKYKAALREEIEASIRIEPGVLALNAVSEKRDPTRITILEIYASEDAYKAHVASRHFQKYKLSTQKMVKSLELIETDPILIGAK